MFVIGFIDNFVVVLAQDGGLWQFHAVRAALAVSLMLFAARILGATVRPKRLRNVAIRSAFVAASMLIYFGCLAVLPIGVVLSGLFTSPAFVLLISICVLHQSVGWARWLAVGLGFAGTLLVIQPDPGNLQWLVFLPVLAGALYGAGAVATRTLCEDETTLTLLVGFFTTLGLFGVVGLAALAILQPDVPAGTSGFALRGWVPLTAELMGLIALQAVGSILGIGLIIRGYQIGDVSHVAVFEFSVLVFASVWAFVLFGDRVNSLAIAGMGLIIVSGSIIALRSRSTGGSQ